MRVVQQRVIEGKLVDQKALVAAAVEVVGQAGIAPLAEGSMPASCSAVSTRSISIATRSSANCDTKSGRNGTTTWSARSRAARAANDRPGRAVEDDQIEVRAEVLHEALHAPAHLHRDGVGIEVLL